MVRLVFRPYAQVRKAICTSAHLRASTRVSSGFALLRHSSPSFGSHRARSDANHSRAAEAVGRRRRRPSTSLRPRAWRTRRLARALDSLVRVSRRVDRARDATRRRGARPGGARGRSRRPMRPPGHPAPHGRPRPRHACAAGGPSRARAGDSREGIRRARAPRSSASLPTVSGTCHSLSKVLVTFPSRYLFAIGLPDVRSLGWDSPPDWGCTPKQPDSPEPPRAAGAGGGHGIVTLSDAAPQRTSPPRPAKSGPGTPQLAERAIPGVGSARFARRYSGRPRSFLFLRLVICLSSAGGLVGRQVNSGAARSRARGRPPPRHRAPARRRAQTRPGGSREPGSLLSAGRPYQPGRGGRARRRGLCASLDADAGVLSAETSSTMCVRRFHGSRRSAIHDTHRVSRRSSSTREPRHPPPKVVALPNEHDLVGSERGAARHARRAARGNGNGVETTQ